ncbi:hypothetical protein N7454_011008 [Penicillium verhagenii]|nr:hypothetical protein N7454_011008 [Penicillium verhagenii]
MRACAARGISRDDLPYKAIGQPYLAWYGLFFNVLIAITQGFTSFIPTFNVTDFFIAYICVIIFVVLYAGHKLWTRSPFINPAEADLDTGRIEFHKETEIPQAWYWRAWGWLTK